MATFHISFRNGICRYTRANNLDAAIVEIKQAVEATMVNASLLDDKLHVIGTASLGYGSIPTTYTPKEPT